jgi:hypothetical protein
VEVPAASTYRISRAGRPPPGRRDWAGTSRLSRSCTPGRPERSPPLAADSRPLGAHQGPCPRAPLRPRWRAATDQELDRLDSVTEWLRRAGPGRVLKSPRASVKIDLGRLIRSREWLKTALLECGTCHQIVERQSPAQRHCRECRVALKRLRSAEAVASVRQARRRVPSG